MKKILSKKQRRWLKRKTPIMQKGAVPSLLVAMLLIASFAYKKPVEAYYYDDGGSAGRGALFGGLTGAAFGGAIGGGKGAAIGAGVGVLGGALIGGSRSRGRDPYRKLDREERRLGKLQDQAASLQDQMQSVSSEKRRNRLSRKLASVQNKIRSKEREVSRLKGRLGVRQQGAQQQQPAGRSYRR